jgi:type III secretion system FlhB-like substrate exporter
MIISDLTYLETASNTSGIVGGGSRKTAVAVNYNKTNQFALALSGGKKSTAVAVNYNKTNQTAVAIAD